eukprot:gene10758-12729_t
MTPSISSATDESSATSGVKVFVRFRPLNKREIDHEASNGNNSSGACVCFHHDIKESDRNDHMAMLHDGNSLQCDNADTTFDASGAVSCEMVEVRDDDHEIGHGSAKTSGHQFSFDRIFKQSASQMNIFDSVGKPLVDTIMQGFSGAIITYGQTSSGKTWTMEGASTPTHQRGLLPRIVNHIAHTITTHESGWEFTIDISVVEIYMERIRDLLDVMNTDIRIHEEKGKGTWLGGMTKLYVQSEQEVIDILALGAKNRAVGATDMNADSSRSHLICILTITSHSAERALTRTGQLFLTDLAGCEKVDKTGASGLLLEEAKGINKSLSSLAKVATLQKQLTDNGITCDPDPAGSILHRDADVDHQDTFKRAPECVVRVTRGPECVVRVTRAAECVVRVTRAPECVVRVTRAPECVVRVTRAPECVVRVTRAPECVVRVTRATECVVRVTRAAECAVRVTRAAECVVRVTRAPECVVRVTRAPECVVRVTRAAECVVRVTRAPECLVRVTRAPECVVRVTRAAECVVRVTRASECVVRVTRAAECVVRVTRARNYM